MKTGIRVLLVAALLLGGGLAWWKLGSTEGRNQSNSIDVAAPGATLATVNDPESRSFDATAERASSGADGQGSTSERDAVSAAEDGSHGASAQAKARNPREKLEARVVVPEGIRVEEVNSLLNSRRFEDVIDSISRGATADTLQLTNAYRRSFDAALAKSKFQLGDIACGEHVCAATFSSNVNDEDAFFNAAMTEGDRPKIFGIVVNTIQPPRDGDPTQYRVIFSTDPNHPGLVAKTEFAPPPAKK